MSDCIQLPKDGESVHIGAMMIVKAPSDTAGFSHDAKHAFHCGGYVYFFYENVKEWLISDTGSSER